MAVTDPPLFVTKIVGTMGLFQTSQVQNYLRSIIISKLTDVLGESKKGLFDLPAMFNEISTAMRAKVTDDFALLGIGIKQFFLKSVSPTRRRSRPSTSARPWAPSAQAPSSSTRPAWPSAASAARPRAAAPAAAAKTGMGLGAGMGMGAAMAGVMAQAMQQATQPKAPAAAAPAAAAPAAAAPANPTTPAEVQALLDTLDLRLANGEISESTYDKLYARWETRLKEMGG